MRYSTVQDSCPIESTSRVQAEEGSSRREIDARIQYCTDSLLKETLVSVLFSSTQQTATRVLSKPYSYSVQRTAFQQGDTASSGGGFTASLLVLYSYEELVRVLPSCNLVCDEGTVGELGRTDAGGQRRRQRIRYCDIVTFPNRSARAHPRN